MNMAPGQLILVVEDDDSLRTAMERVLKACDFKCNAFGSAEELLAHGSYGDAACLVCDWQLPGMSGLDLLDELRRGHGPPLILITAHERSGLREEALRHGAAAYLAKPFLGTVLVNTIKAVIGPALS